MFEEPQETGTTTATSGESEAISMFTPSLDPENTFPHLITQEDFNDIIRDCKLSGRSAELLASRLKQWNLVADTFKVTANRKRQHTKDFDDLFAHDEGSGISYCCDVDQLFENLNHHPIPMNGGCSSTLL